jgi:hypothetical protein
MTKLKNMHTTKNNTSLLTVTFSKFNAGISQVLTHVTFAII